MAAKRPEGGTQAAVDSFVASFPPTALVGQSPAEGRLLLRGRRRLAPSSCLSLAVLPQADLLAMTAALADPQVHGVLSAGGLDPAEATELARRLSQPYDPPGPDWPPGPDCPDRPDRSFHPLLDPAPATPVYELPVDGYARKSAAAAEIARFAAGCGLRRRACDQVEEATDELLLNALYDAPTDESGRPRHRHVPAAARVHLRVPPAEQVLLRACWDGRRFAVVVRDPFGALQRGTVVSYLQRCARARAERRDPVLGRPGGAGVGLYLVAGCATELIFRLRPGTCTEVVYALDCGGRSSPAPLRALVIDDGA